ncbi:MAG: ribonuclease HI family protein [Thermaerobacter sp.]|nr:ribonuclease HI family protein [Thermaerobacter sp.]
MIHTDGASRGNPGESGIGIVMYDGQGSVVKEFCRFIGTTTNNVAEYSALIEALRAAHGLGAEEVAVRSDSELMVKQILGELKVRHDGLQPLFVEARRLFLRFRQWRIEYVPREQNRRADELANLSIDRQHK